MEWDDEIGPQCNLCETTQNIWICYELLLQCLDPSHWSATSECGILVPLVYFAGVILAQRV